MEILSWGHNSLDGSIDVIGEDRSVFSDDITNDTYNFSSGFVNLTEELYFPGTPDDGRPGESRASKVLVTLVVSLLIIFITLGNLATIVVVCVYKRLRTVSNLYLASLATADLLVGLPVMTFMLLYTVTFNRRWVFGAVVCDMWTYLDYVSCTSSLTNVCAIAGDRFITLAQPLRSIRKRTKKRVLKVILAVWFFPLAFWLAIIISLRVLHGRPPGLSCHLVWQPDVITVVSVVVVVYLPLTSILVLFVAILGLLKHHMGSMSERLHRSSSYRESLQDDEEANAEQAGGISFNPRCVEVGTAPQSTGAAGVGLVLEALTGHSADASGQFVSTAVGPDAGNAADEEELYILGGRKFRTVATSTSPERFGLVRTVGTNTSPSLHRREVAFATSIPDVANVGRSLVDAATVTTTTPSAASISSRSRLLLVEPRSPEDSDTDTVRTFSTGSSSTSRESRTDESELRLVRLGTKLRRHYASLLRSEREGSLERARFKQQVRAARILGVIMGFLLLCWLPFAICWPLRTFCPSCISQELFDLSIWTNYINSAINPVIYCLFNPSFRRAFKKLFLRRCPCRWVCIRCCEIRH